MRSEMASRSRSAGVSRGSVPDLRRVVDLHQHSGVNLGQGHHGSVEQVGGNVTLARAADDGAGPEDGEQRDSYNVTTATNHHHHQHPAVTSSSSTTAVKIDEVYRIGNHVPMDFGDIFVQPTALDNGDIGRFLAVPVRRVFGFVFSYTQEAVYYFLSIVAGLVFGVAWGSVFGLLDFVTIWVAQPAVSVYCVLLRATSMPLRATVRCLLDPFFEAAAQTFRHITVRSFVQPVRPVTAAAVAGQTTSNGQTGQPIEWLGFV